MLSVIMLSVTFSYGEWCYAECRYAKCHWQYAEFHYAECHYAECRYTGCSGNLRTSTSIRNKFTQAESDFYEQSVNASIDSRNIKEEFGLLEQVKRP